MPEDKNVIESDQLDLTKWGTRVAGALGIIGPAAYAIFKDATGGELQMVVIPSVGAIIVASMIAMALIISADGKARAEATAAKLVADARLAESSTANLDAAIKSLLQAPAELYKSLDGGGTVPLGGILGAKVKGEGDQGFIVLGVRRDLENGKTEYLVARVGGGLEWKPEGDIEEVQDPFKKPASE